VILTIVKSHGTKEKERRKFLYDLNLIEDLNDLNIIEELNDLNLIEDLNNVPNL
jgi:hypothetical protein